MTPLLQINPGLWLVAAGLLCFALPRVLRKWVMVGAPVVAGALVWTTLQAFPDGHIAGQLDFGGFALITYRLDALSRVWALVFCLAAFLNGLYSWHERAPLSDGMALIYSGAALAAVCVGDLLSLFVFWELTVLSSVFLVWAGGPRSWRAGLRYMAWHIVSGVLLLAGAVMQVGATGDLVFAATSLAAPGAWLLLLGMGIKAGFPLLHMWIADAYPKASVTGTVVLSAFTTKLAVYALARSFAGEPLLVAVGATMAVFPVFLAFAENDLRRTLAYALNSQLGFMVCGVGIGTGLALNGVAAHAAASAIYQGLLFMGVGAVLHRVGTAKASDLGGLFRSMPVTAALTALGGASIAALPLFSGFVTKSMILSAALYEHHYAALGALIFASAGAVLHTTLKVPLAAFFGADRGVRPPEAPLNMRVAMGLAALVCVGVALPGVYPLLYGLLPAPEYGYAPYTPDHIVFQLQLVLAAALVFGLFARYLARYGEGVWQRATLLDADVLYRRLGLAAARWSGAMLDRLGAGLESLGERALGGAGRRLYALFSPVGGLAAATPVNLPGVAVAAALAVAILIALLAG